MTKLTSGASGRERKRRRVVAYQVAEGIAARAARMALDGDKDVLPHQARRGDTYWCAADKPDVDRFYYSLKPVYDGTTVPEDAQCDECAISIRELQEMIGARL